VDPDSALVRIGVVGGSASTSHALPESSQAWPEILADQIGQPIELIKRQAPLLSIARGTTLIAEIPECDILILHFATSIGWPEIHRRFQRYLVMAPNPQTSFHLPPKLSSLTKKRVSKFFKRSLRALVKYLAFPLGLYKPRNNINDLDDQINTALAVAHSKAPIVIWLQHNALMVNRLFIEKRTYLPYYKKVIAILRGLDDPATTLVELPERFMVHENFLWDGVHLSPLGHQRCAELIRSQLSLTD